jgi:hypothetical protein
MTLKPVPQEHTRTVSIRLWRHFDSQDWSVEIDGAHHSHVSSATVDALAEYAVALAQQVLLQQETAALGGEKSDQN